MSQGGDNKVPILQISSISTKNQTDPEIIEDYKSVNLNLRISFIF